MAITTRPGGRSRTNLALGEFNPGRPADETRPVGRAPAKRASALGNLTVKTKLLASFGVLLAFAIVIAALGTSVASSARSNAVASSRNVGLTRALKQLQLDGTETAVAENSVAFDYASHSGASGDLASFAAARAAFAKDATLVASYPLTSPERADLAAANKAFNAYASLSSSINRDFALNTKASLAAAATGVAALAFSTVTTPLGSLVTSVDKAVSAASASSISSANAGELLVLLIGGAAVLLAIASAIIITRAISRPIAALNDTLVAVEGGDLEVRAPVTSSDELGRVASSLNRAINAQQEARREIDAQSKAQGAAAADHAAVIEILAALHATESVEEASGEALSSILSGLRWSGGAWWAAEGGALRLDRSVGTSLAPVSSNLATRALASGGVVVSDALEPLACPRVEAAASAGYDLAIAVPVRVDGSVAAVLEFFGRGGGHAIDPWRSTAMANVADIVGQALERIQIQVRERASEQALREKVDAILNVVSSAARGDLTVEVPVSGSDAIGQVGSGLAQLLGDLRQRVATIGETSTVLASATDELLGTSGEMSASSARTSEQSDIAASSSEAVLSQIESVSAAAEELTASIREIAKNSADAARVAQEATTAAEATNGIVHKLGASSEEIGNVVKVITTIAQQTNLLALNATIEAARAGEAGKGFAVVAGEVKDLARETATATEDIATKVAAIQEDTTGAIEAIGEIKEIIERISELQSAIAAAVEEQTATTNEIARSVSGAAMSASSISSTAGEVAGAASTSASAAETTARSARELAVVSNELRSLVERFRF